MIKLIASDIDGTLVADGTGHINPEIYEVITKLHAQGKYIAIATGRHWSSLESVFYPIRDKIFYISDNGAFIGIKDRALFVRAMDQELAHRIIHSIQENEELIAVVATKDGYFVDKEDTELIEWIREGYKGRIELVEDLTTAGLEIIKISAYAKDSIYPYAYLKEMYEQDLDVNFAGEVWLDFTSKGVSKGSALTTLQESLDVDFTETMAFGDQGNDVDMLKNAYYSFAVANAVDEVKKVARFEADTNANDGVLKMLRNLLE